MNTDELVKNMVNKFLGWRLPDDFQPDAGISFSKTKHPTIDMQPVGTNLFTATQAEEMVRYMLEDFEAQRQQSENNAVLGMADRLHTRIFHSTVSPTGQFVKDCINEEIDKVHEIQNAELKANTTTASEEKSHPWRTAPFKSITSKGKK